MFKLVSLNHSRQPRRKTCISSSQSNNVKIVIIMTLENLIMILKIIFRIETIVIITEISVT